MTEAAAGAGDELPGRVSPNTPFVDDDGLLNVLQAVSRQFVAMTASALSHLEAKGGLRVSLPEYRVLVVLTSEQPRRPSELALELEVTRAAIAQILRRLESARLLSRRTDRTDRRSAMISLTAKGARVVKAVLAERERRLRPALRELTARERRALAGSLGRLHAALVSSQASST